MRTSPMIPIPLMIIFCGVLIFLVLKRDKRITHILMIILLFVINLRIMIPQGTTKKADNNVDILFAIDSTISMNAEDYNGNHKRLDGVKADCQKIIAKLNGARFSLITFNNDAKVMIPFTKDSDMAYQAIDIIEPIEKLYAKGSSLNTPKEVIYYALKDSHDKDPDRLRVLFFISDGEITDESTLKSYSAIKKYVDDGVVLGYGTAKGGYMQQNNKYAFSEEDKAEYIMDYSNGYKKAISKIDEKNLQRIANDMGLDYIHMENYPKIEKKLTEIENKMSYEMKSTNKTNYEDIYYYFVFPLLLLIAIDLRKYRRDTI